MTRAASITQRIDTKFGAHYAGVSIRGGRVVGIALQSPGKFDNTEIQDLLDTIIITINQMIEDTPANASSD